MIHGKYNKIIFDRGQTYGIIIIIIKLEKKIDLDGLSANAMCHVQRLGEGSSYIQITFYQPRPNWSHVGKIHFVLYNLFHRVKSSGETRIPNPMLNLDVFSTSVPDGTR